MVFDPAVRPSMTINDYDTTERMRSSYPIFDTILHIQFPCDHAIPSVGIRTSTKTLICRATVGLCLIIIADMRLCYAKIINNKKIS